MATPNTSKKPRSKPPRSRPAATSTLSQPVVEDASYLTAISAFSPDGNLFAFLSLALDKHRLRVYETTNAQSTAEHVFESARVTSLIWSTTSAQNEDTTSSPSKKKRKKRNSLGTEEELPSVEAVVVGLSNGTVLFFSPTHSRVVRTLSHPSSIAAVVSLEISENTLWSSSADGAIRLWDIRKNDILSSWKTEDRIPYTSIAVRPHSDNEDPDVLAASHALRLLSSATSTGSLEPQKPTVLASFTGHASSIKHLEWDDSQAPATRFVTAADADRFVYVWQVPDQDGAEGKIVASIPLDSDVRGVSFSGGNKQNLLTLSASGKIFVFPVPSEFAVPPASSNRAQHKVPTLLSRTSIFPSSKPATSAHVTSAVFVPKELGRIRVARIVAGVRPVFDLVAYLDESGEFISEVKLDDIPASLANESRLAAPNKRYTETASLVVRSGAEIGQDAEMDDIAVRDIDGDLDVDVAELSLGQRLTALSGGDDTLNPQNTSDSDQEDDSKSQQKSSKKSTKTTQEASAVPANSLTRTLIQALHSSDARLLETCLAHSDQELIRNTIRRLPPQLAVPLITACVERLGRGARAGNMKGGGGAASSQRASGLIVWIKTVLAVHSGHLMTLPDLVARLANLHATLTTRLTLQESLLTLSGRLDMVLSQIEMRSSTAPAPLAPLKGDKKVKKTRGKEVSRYVEGESEDEQMDVEIEVDSDAGSIEDVELGGSSSDSENSQEDDSDEEDSEGPTMNGFIDDEAEEDYSDEDDSE